MYKMEISIREVPKKGKITVVDRDYWVAKIVYNYSPFILDSGISYVVWCGMVKLSISVGERIIYGSLR